MSFTEIISNTIVSLVRSLTCLQIFWKTNHNILVQLSFDINYMLVQTAQVKTISTIVPKSDVGNVNCKGINTS